MSILLSKFSAQHHNSTPKQQQALLFSLSTPIFISSSSMRITPPPLAKAFVKHVVLPATTSSFRSWLERDSVRVAVVALDLTRYFWTVVSCWTIYGVVASLTGVGSRESQEGIGRHGWREIRNRALRTAKECTWLLLHSFCFSLAFVNVFYPVGIYIFEWYYNLTAGNDPAFEMFLLWRTFISQLLASTITFPLIKLSNKQLSLASGVLVWVCASIYSFIVFQRNNPFMGRR